jgi:hypothetical protein
MAGTGRIGLVVLVMLAGAHASGEHDGVQVSVGYSGLVVSQQCAALRVVLPPGKGTATIGRMPSLPPGRHSPPPVADHKVVRLGATPTTCWVTGWPRDNGPFPLGVRLGHGPWREHRPRVAAYVTEAPLELRRGIGPMARAGLIGPDVPVALVDPETIPLEPVLAEPSAPLLLREFVPAAGSPLARALESWVRRGGRLVLVGGAGLRGGFGGFTVGAPAAVTDADRAVLSARYGPDGWRGEGLDRLSLVRAVADGEAVVRAGDRVLLARRTLGLGQVVFLAAAWRNDELWRDALRRAADHGWPSGELRPWLEASVAHTAVSVRGQGWTGALLALVYLALVIVLPRSWAQRRGRPDAAWAASAVLAVGGLVAIGATATALNGRRQRADAATAVRVASGQRHGAAMTVVGLYGPGHQRRVLRVPPGAQLVSTAATGPGGSAEAEQDGVLWSEAAARGPDGSLVHTVATRPWVQRQVSYDIAWDLGGTVDLRLEHTGSGLAGSVTNRLPLTLRNVWLVAGQRGIWLPDLAPGAETEVRFAHAEAAKPDVWDYKRLPDKLLPSLPWTAVSDDHAARRRVMLTGVCDQPGLPPGVEARAAVTTHRLVVCVVATPPPAPGVPTRVALLPGGDEGGSWPAPSWHGATPALHVPYDKPPHAKPSAWSYWRGVLPHTLDECRVRRLEVRLSGAGAGQRRSLAIWHRPTGTWRTITTTPAAGRAFVWVATDPESYVVAGRVVRLRLPGPETAERAPGIIAEVEGRVGREP